MKAKRTINVSALASLGQRLDGSLAFDSLSRKIYSTDASVYQQQPLAVAFPASESDIQRLIEFAIQNSTSLIPRTAGTSLAGQVVGDGIVVDAGKHMKAIGEIDLNAKTVVVEPGVVRDELNLALAQHGLFFGPETSTSNRAMIGGMLGNNSCGSNSIVYGTTRDQTLEVTGFFSDGSRATLSTLSKSEFLSRGRLNSREGEVYRTIGQILSPAENRATITSNFPKESIHRRNTGYAIDALMDCDVFDDASTQRFNLSKLIAGSEGTLFFATSIKLQLQELPPQESGLLCVHFTTVDEALRANRVAMQFPLFASELIDNLILEGAARNKNQRENLAFVEGSPGAILILDLRGHSRSAVTRLAEEVTQALQQSNFGYAWPLLVREDIRRVWELRKAGLGVVGNVPGDDKPTTVIEDTAVAIEDLPNYIADVDQMLQQKYDCQCVRYAHAGSGEIHLRPVINLKRPEGVEKFRAIATDVAALVKTYRGSLSGEHGDGLLRSEFIESQIGAECYSMLRKLKQAFDPQGVFNPGKIVDPRPMDRQLRQASTTGPSSDPETVLDFSATKGLQRAAEMCTGSGDCRKNAVIGGTMCPSFMATGNEKDSTRARANIVRQAIVEAGDLATTEVRDAMELCLSCKGCKSECPSNVDVGKMKAEFLQAWHDRHGVPRRAKLIAGIDRLNHVATKVRWLSNFAATNWVTSWILKRLAGFSPRRSLPTLSAESLKHWYGQHTPHPNAGRNGSVLFFCDEFTNFNEAEVGIAAIELLERLGWSVGIPDHVQSGRAAISQGMLRDAKEIAAENVRKLHPFVTAQQPLIGIEPSAILAFRDEYLDLLSGTARDAAKKLMANVLTFEEFVAAQVESKTIKASQFTTEAKTVRLHGHCHEKSLVGLVPAIRALSVPENYRVRTIPSGCCGMAGGFGYAAEHYQTSMDIGELVLFPTIRKEPEENLISASGTSCRHQIKDGTGRTAMHPAQILREALVSDESDAK